MLVHVFGMHTSTINMRVTSRMIKRWSWQNMSYSRVNWISGGSLVVGYGSLYGYKHLQLSVQSVKHVTRCNVTYNVGSPRACVGF